MYTYDNINIIETPEYGTVFKCSDVELADQFEDFLTECCFVFFNVKFESDVVSILFGQAANPINVRALFERFVKQSNIK